MQELSITNQTLQNRLKWLLKNKWITVNLKTRNYRLASFRIIHRKLKCNIKKAVIWDDYDFKSFRAFIEASIIIYYAKRKYIIDKRERWKDSKSGVIKRRTRKRCAPPSFPIPVNYLAKAINKSSGSIVNMKQNAEKFNFISIKKNFTELHIPIKEINLYRKHSPNNGNKIVCSKGKVFEQLPDSITPHLVLKIKSNLKQ